MAKKGNGDSKDRDAKQAKIVQQIIATAKKHGIPIQVGNMDPALQEAAGQRDLIVQVRQNQGNVVIDFGQSISWCAMTPEQATKFAATIIKQVHNITGISALGGGQRPEQDPAADDKEVDNPEK